MTGQDSGRHAIRPGRPVVVKVGSSSLVHVSGQLDPDALRRTVTQVADLWAAGHPTVLVSSGAVAAGLPIMSPARRPRDVPGLQAAAAVGQGRLMERYAALFHQRDLVVGQVLLTKDVFANRTQYLHARHALDRMLSLGVVPIVNENDAVVADELRLGDNDRLAAIVSLLVSAAILVMLTDTAGIYTADPKTVDDAELLTAVRSTDLALDAVTVGGTGPFGSGGPATKIAAARMAAWSGIPTVIADAAERDVMARVVGGEEVGTWVTSHPSKLPARKLWIAFGQPAEGRLAVDRGATRALLEEGKSLLAVGISSVHGSFSPDSAVEVDDPDGALIGKGLVAMSADRVREALGRHSSEVGGVVIHRDDFVLLALGRAADRLTS